MHKTFKYFVVVTQHLNSYSALTCNTACEMLRIIYETSICICVIHCYVEDAGAVSEWCGWLRLNSRPEARVLSLWNKTVKARLSFIHLDKPTVDDVISQWPRYADDDGHILVSEKFGISHLCGCIFVEMLHTK